MSRHTNRPDVHGRITEAIVADLERGVRPWTKPWSTGDGRITRPLRHNGVPYSGINVVLLWSEAVARGFASSIWMTFRQAAELGGHVRKGETGSTVVYADRMRRVERDEDGEEIEREIPFLKAYTVFCVDQIADLPAHFYGRQQPLLHPARRIAAAESFFAATGADIRSVGAEACYVIGLDRIHMPPFEHFRDPESYYATLGHECIHWTRHPGRLDRDLGRERFGDEGYAREELVAELGAAFLCADLGLSLEPRPDHARYIAAWLAVLRHDRRFIVGAAAHAQRAVDYLHGLQPHSFGRDAAS